MKTGNQETFVRGQIRTAATVRRFSQICRNTERRPDFGHSPTILAFRNRPRARGKCFPSDCVRTLSVMVWIRHRGRQAQSSPVQSNFFGGGRNRAEPIQNNENLRQCSNGFGFVPIRARPDDPRRETPLAQPMNCIRKGIEPCQLPRPIKFS
jgi:hypothetical protein